jgi:glycosyltransferase involved in cell wall biosynthesis
VLPAIVPAARGLRIPVVAHVHIPMTPVERLHLLVHQTDAVVGVAEHVVAELAAEGMPADRVRVIPNAVDEARLAAGDATGLRAALGIPAGACVAASVGSLIRRKGHDVSVRAVARARASGADVRLLVCGDGEEAGSLRTLAADLGAGDSVHFLGLRGDVGAVLRDASDLYVSAARDEALPLNVLEAQWAGLAAVCSDIPAHHEAMQPGRTGVLVPGEDANALAAAIVALAGDPARRAAMGAAGRALVRDQFTMDRYVSRFAALYDELLARPAAAYGWVRGARWPKAYTAWLVGAARRRLRR